MLAAPVSPAVGYTFGEPSVRAVGSEVTVFDWSADRCNDTDIPDQPSRAYRNAAGQVVLVNTHFTARPKIGSTLATVVRSCSVMMTSHSDADPAKYNDKEWIASPWTPDGNTVYALVHAEYQGYNHDPGYCIRSGESFADKQKCWYNALTLATSTNGGATFGHAAAPDHYVAGPPYRYSAGIGPVGFFQPSNIVQGKDGYHYVLVHVEDYGVQPYGACLWRTNDLSNPRAWRAWDGAGFNVVFRDPYRFTFDAQEGVCTPVSRGHIGTLSESLTWSTYLEKWVLVGSADNADGRSGPGFYWYTSNDLVNWSPARLLMRGPLPWTQCSPDTEVLRDPSLLDNDSQSRNFETIGRRPFLFFTRFHLNSCSWSLDRDLVRIPLEFTKDPDPPPPPPPPPDPDPQPDPTPSPEQGGDSSQPSQTTPATVNVSAPPLGRFRIVGKPRSRRDGSLQVRVRVPSAGRLEIRASGARRAIRPATRKASKAGDLTISVRLSAAGRELLRTKRRAKVKAKLVFRPVGAAPQRAQHVLLLSRAA